MKRLQTIAGKWWRKLSQRARYRCTMAAVVVMCLGFFLLAVRLKDAEIAGWGGGLSASAALLILFLRPDWGRDLYQKRALAGQTFQEKIEGLEQWLTINSKGQGDQNKMLVIASVVGNLFWCFGEKLAAVVIAHLYR